MNGNTTFFLEGRDVLVEAIVGSICRKLGQSSNPYIAAPADAVSIIARGAQVVPLKS
jgi:hypothetical protein